MTTKATVRVAAGVLLRDDQVLVAKRPQGKHGAGFWEFPGGKVDAGETAEQALLRELHEELDILIAGCDFAISNRHDYPERIVELHFYTVRQWTGEPRGAEGQQLRWCRYDELPDQQLMPANQRVVDWLLAQRSANT